MATLEQQLTDLCDKHGLTSIGISILTLPDGERFFSVTAQDKRHCGSSKGASHSITASLPEAIADLAAKRSFVATELAPLELAA